MHYPQLVFNPGWQQPLVHEHHEHQDPDGTQTRHLNFVPSAPWRVKFELDDERSAGLPLGRHIRVQTAQGQLRVQNHTDDQRGRSHQWELEV